MHVGINAAIVDLSDTRMNWLIASSPTSGRLANVVNSRIRRPLPPPLRPVYLSERAVSSRPRSVRFRPQTGQWPWPRSFLAITSTSPHVPHQAQRVSFSV